MAVPSIWRRAVSITATVGLLGAMLASTGGQAAAASLSIGVSSTVVGWTASIDVTVNRSSKAIATCDWVLDMAPPIDCGAPSDAAKGSTSYRIVLTDLADGDHQVSVTVRLTDRGVEQGSTSFSVPVPCSVTNQRTAARYNGSGSNLQAAINESGVGDTLAVRGHCIGTFRLATKTLTLLGIATDDDPVATLDGGGVDRVIFMDWCPPNVPCTTDITLTDLLITNGYRSGAGYDIGGGIYNNHGTLTLNGSTEVSGNHATYGGGIGTYGSVTLADSVVVTGNTATISGGGVFDIGGPLNLAGAAEVTGNVAGESGGGISHPFGVTTACGSWTGAISPNTPDDPPALTILAC